jgi:hypothetical protein
MSTPSVRGSIARPARKDQCGSAQGSISPIQYMNNVLGNNPGVQFRSDSLIYKTAIDDYKKFNYGSIDRPPLKTNFCGYGRTPSGEIAIVTPTSSTVNNRETALYRQYDTLNADVSSEISSYTPDQCLAGGSFPGSWEYALCGAEANEVSEEGGTTPDSATNAAENGSGSEESEISEFTDTLLNGPTPLVGFIIARDEALVEGAQSVINSISDWF